MAQELLKARLGLIEGVSDGLLKDLTDCLRNTNPPVINAREANEILQAHAVTQDRTGKLVDMVRNKGDQASFIMIAILEKRDNLLARELGLLTDSLEEARLSRLDLKSTQVECETNKEVDFGL
ncbi:hypothetical protein AMELA_G00083200 [Ameiurus melas]|uniref:CARD domain-containing protein n=1 Tax=Ameiurus melas TaxID=219545 RepID=A0A7J6B2A9_AMEME|nr:hypothetical protein AMELA_G00083200 [Ameiurus melas]